MTEKAPIPEDGQHITPYFTVSDADRLIKFLSAAFGAVVVKEDRYDDGRIQHARMRVGQSLLMLNESNEVYAANVSQLHIYIADADETHATALAHGATSVMEPNDRPHGDRMAGIKDPCQNIWWIASLKD